MCVLVLAACSARAVEIHFALNEEGAGNAGAYAAPAVSYAGSRSAALNEHGGRGRCRQRSRLLGTTTSMRTLPCVVTVPAAGGGRSAPGLFVLLFVILERLLQTAQNLGGRLEHRLQ